MEAIGDYYAELRAESDSRALPVTVRTLETVIRLSSAAAKARLSGSVEIQDVDTATTLIDHVLKSDKAPKGAATCALNRSSLFPVVGFRAERAVLGLGPLRSSTACSGLTRLPRVRPRSHGTPPRCSSVPGFGAWTATMLSDHVLNSDKAPKNAATCIVNPSPCPAV